VDFLLKNPYFRTDRTIKTHHLAFYKKYHRFQAQIISRIPPMFLHLTSRNKKLTFAPYLIEAGQLSINNLDFSHHRSITNPILTKF